MISIRVSRRLAAALVAAFALFAAAAPAADAATARSEAAEFYESALRLFAEADYDAAVIELRNALQVDPDHLPARLLIGRAYLRMGNPGSAEIALRRARELGIDEDHVLGPLALSYLMQGKYEELLAEIPTGGRSLDSRADVLVARGMAFLELRRWDDADLAFDMAGDLVPDDPAPVIGQVRALLIQGRRDDAEAVVEANREVLFAGGVEAWYWYVKGEAARLRGESADAASHYGEALAVNPDHLAAIVGRAAARIEVGDDQGALTDLERAYELMPDEPQVAYLYALLQAESGNPDAARDALTAAGTQLTGVTLEEMREHPPTLLMAGIVSYNQGMQNQAEAYLARYITVRPHHVGARRFLGRVRLRLDDPVGAVTALEPARDAAPNDVEVLELLGDGYLRLDRYQQALSAFEAALPQTENPAAVRTGIAMSLIGLGRGEEAVAALEDALGIDPAFADAALLLTVRHLDRRDYEAALAVADRLAEMAPEEPVAHNLAGAALFGLGDAEAARARFDQALAIEPDFFPAHANLARLDAAQGNHDLAFDRFRSILAENPAEVRATLALSQLAESQGDLAAAIDWLERYLGQVPDAEAQEIRLVDLYLAAGDPDLALRLAGELRRRDGNDFAFRDAEARALLALGRSREAVEAFRSISDFIAEDAAQFTRTANFLLQLNDLEGARTALDRAYEADPEYGPARVLLARLEIDLGNRARALAIARELQGLDGSRAIGSLLVGDLLMAEGDPAGAAESYAAAMELAPNSELAWRLYRARRDTGEPDAALADLEAWSAGRPGDYTARRALAVAYLQLGRRDDALAAHEALLEDRPEDLVVLNNLAVLYQEIGDARAIDYARRAYELAPEEPATIDTLGWILVQQGQPERGLPLLREAHARAGENAEIRYHIAVALHALGRTEAARSELESALSGGDDFYGIEDARRLLESLAGS